VEVFQRAVDARAMQHQTTFTPTHVECVVVGGGPAGAVLALLLARQGVEVMLLEAHRDFERDFRGDTVHPATLELLEQLGLLERLYDLPHTRLADFPTHFPDGSVSPPAKPMPHTKYPHSYQVPQARFIELLVDEARRYPTFHLAMGARVEQLIEEDGRVLGVRFRTQDGMQELRADLIVGADGRFSKVRQLAGMELKSAPETMDVLWLRMPYAANDPERAHGVYIGTDSMLVVTRRRDGWQIGFILAKGGYQRLREAGLESLRQSIEQRAPWLADRTPKLRDWSETSLLVVDAGRVGRWYRLGLLLIGDAAHVMSPVFGVGINFAIQDAIVASNILGPRLRQHTLSTADLAAVQRRREWPTRLMQRMQRQMRPRFTAGSAPSAPPAWLMALLNLPPIADLRGRLVAYGGWQPERVQQSESETLVSASRRAAATASSSDNWRPRVSAMVNSCVSRAASSAARVRSSSARLLGESELPTASSVASAAPINWPPSNGSFI
jgi:2-polyprenyl-6-methoxyphenol hydroxylase-like FAD-dependent oxidoreductase